MPTRICLLALIGLPASGKTMFSKWLFELPQTAFNVIHICYDDHFPQPTNETSSETKFEFKKERTQIFSIIRELIDALKNTNRFPNHLNTTVKSSLHADCYDFLIICDDNNYYRSMRYKLYQLCKQTECAYAQIYFEGHLEMALQRNSERPAVERVSQKTIQQMAKRLEAPDSATQRWESNTVILNEYTYKDCSAMKIKILEFLGKTFKNTLRPSPVQEKAKNVQSLVHQLDLLLRRRVAEILHTEHANTLERQERARNLNTKRKDILQNFKTIAEEGMSVDELNEYANLLH
ncbi:L-seryl-tRNA(Sec) kinase [Anastrepha obliqua]|uniref:L-seryl-tRNA(Sec) kinase n=1 Tax=Anastrepha obliqua TaxID=95512 RepID=UPI00240A957E|nr:L-seryl-tRNA(Sec) kinase [Anastrepha obliqua]